MSEIIPKDYILGLFFFSIVIIGFIAYVMCPIAKMIINKIEKPISNEQLAILILEAEKQELLLKKVDCLNRRWDVLIKLRSLALKDPNLDNYRKIDSEIDFVKLQLQTILNFKKP